MEPTGTQQQSSSRSFTARLSIRRCSQTQRVMGCQGLLALIIEGNMSLPSETERV